MKAPISSQPKRNFWIVPIFFFFLYLLGWSNTFGILNFYPETPLERVYRLLDHHPVIDGHNDLPWSIQSFNQGQLHNLDLFNLSHQATDIQRLKQGRIGAQLWSGFIPCGSSSKGIELKRTMVI